MKIMPKCFRSNQAQMSISERASKFVDDYVPDQIRDIGGALIDGLMALMRELSLIIPSTKGTFKSARNKTFF